MSDRGYQAAIARGLEEALIRATPLNWDAEVDRIIVFSDLHRGQGDHADDFRVCAETYRRAIDFYLGAGYRLVVLGDAEELWEGWPKKVLPTYRGILDTENRFHAAAGERFIKVWGNHDDLWQYPEQVVRHLVPIYGELDVVEGLDVTMTAARTVLGRIFLVHGHQGTGSSDRWGGISRRFVRWVWRPIQRLFKVSLNTPATDFEIRDKHDRAMYEWAAGRNDLVLIAGHTHNPVFVSKPNIESLERVQDSLSATPDGGATAEQLDLEISWARDEASTDGDEDRARPRSCYFNSGCCCFRNGDITGIEIADGEIRLVRWTTEDANPDERIIETRDLATIFAGLGS